MAERTTTVAEIAAILSKLGEEEMPAAVRAFFLTALALGVDPADLTLPAELIGEERRDGGGAAGAPGGDRTHPGEPGEAGEDQVAGVSGRAREGGGAPGGPEPDRPGG